MARFSFPATLANDPARKGQLAAPKQTFGEHRRYAVAPVYTRFDAIEWFVWDAGTQLPDGSPDVIRQEPTLEQAVAGLALTRLTIVETSRDVWRIAFDGSVLGDSRGFRQDQAQQEIRRILAKDASDAAKYGRPLLYTE